MNKLTQALSLTLPLSLSIFGTGCDPSSVAAPTPTAITLASASGTDCPSGGVIVTTFKDSNKNQTLDAAEVVLSSLPMCNGSNGSNGTNGQDGATGATGANGTNGTNGAQGIGAGIQVTVAAAGACPAGGSVLTTFADINNNTLLDHDESLTSISTLCNGTNGSNGSNGTNGTNGTNGASASITTTAATINQCANGGVVYASRVGNAAATLSVVCNGANGQDASFQMGAVGSQVKGKTYTACHHDYLYIPESKESAEHGGRGWLIFRHQKNGTTDQGVGTTGFNMWNVDIANFLLVSEVGNVTYCELNWDPNLRTLTYTVVDKTDGLKGETGLIQFQ